MKCATVVLGGGGLISFLYMIIRIKIIKIFFLPTNLCGRHKKLFTVNNVPRFINELYLFICIKIIYLYSILLSYLAIIYILFGTPNSV